MQWSSSLPQKSDGDEFVKSNLLGDDYDDDNDGGDDDGDGMQSIG